MIVLRSQGEDDESDIGIPWDLPTWVNTKVVYAERTRPGSCATETGQFRTAIALLWLKTLPIHP